MNPKRKRICLIIAMMGTVVSARALYVLAGSSSCEPLPPIDVSTMPFVYTHDANDILLPLFPGDPTRWDLPAGIPYVRPPALACDPDGQLIKRIACQYYTCRIKPTVLYDPNAGTWTTTIIPDVGTDLAVYRVWTVPDNPEKPDPNDVADYVQAWRGLRVNRPPVLH